MALNIWKKESMGSSTRESIYIDMVYLYITSAILFLSQPFKIVVALSYYPKKKIYHYYYQYHDMVIIIIKI